MRRESTPSRPRHLDPAVECAILHCLETDPDARPLRAGGRILPGGDPRPPPSPPERRRHLKSSAAGEIGPQASGRARPAICTCGPVASYSPAGSAHQRYRVREPSVSLVLSQKARDVVQQLGYTATPADSADGFSYDDNYLDYLHDNPKQRTTWTPPLKAVRPANRVLAARESCGAGRGGDEDSSLVPGSWISATRRPSSSGDCSDFA